VWSRNAEGRLIFVVGERSALAPNTSGTGGMPRIGQELGRGAEGVVYEDLDQPGWVVKEFHPGGTSPFEAGNEFQNLERARAIRPNSVVKAQAPADPRQGFLVKEQVLPTDVPEDLAQRKQVLRDFLPQIPDAGGNVMWGSLRIILRHDGC
jgi:RIO-like serine/threonine protein kinase